MSLIFVAIVCSLVGFAQPAGAGEPVREQVPMDCSQLLDRAENTSSVDDQISAISLLIFHDPEDVLPRLLALSESLKHEEVLLEIARTLSKLQDQDSARLIFGRLLDPNRPTKLGTRVIASYRLSTLGSDQGYPWLVSAARSGDSIERQLAAGFLPSFHRFDELRSSESSPLVLSIVLSKDEAFHVRSTLITGIDMAVSDSAAAATEFRDLLANIAQTDPSEMVRADALELLAEILSKETKDLERH